MKWTSMMMMATSLYNGRFVTNRLMVEPWDRTDKTFLSDLANNLLDVDVTAFLPESLVFVPRESDVTTWCEDIGTGALVSTVRTKVAKTTTSASTTTSTTNEEDFSKRGGALSGLLIVSGGVDMPELDRVQPQEVETANLQNDNSDDPTISPITTPTAVSSPSSTSSRTILHLGYIFGKQYWGKGYATELLNGLVSHFKTTNFRGELHAGVARGNPASVRVLQKVGFSSSSSSSHKKMDDEDDDDDDVDWFILQLP